MYPQAKWICEPVGSTTECVVSYAGVPSLVSTSTQIFYQDFLQVSLWIIFLLTLIASGIFYRNFSTRIPKNYK